MEQYAGTDVSLESSNVCVVDATGRIVREAKVSSEPEALIAWFGGLGVSLARIGLLRPARCRNGSMRPCGRRGIWWSCWCRRRPESA